MKKYNRKNHKKKLLLKSSIPIAVLISLLITVNYVISSYQSIADFTFETEPDSSTFLESDAELLEDIAYQIDERYVKYHLILNQSTATTFANDSEQNGGAISYTLVDFYHWSDNEALWTGIDFAGWTFKYLTAINEGNTTMEEFALEVLINMTTGLSLLMAVPNGGIGPEYGGVLARGVCPPDSEEIWPWLFSDEHPKHFNGTGKYSDWRCRSYTSNDEYAGYYLFLSMATKYLLHVPFIQEKVSLIVDQICYNWLKTNFLGIHSTGATTGVEQRPKLFTGGFWAPLILRLGTIHHSEKYEAVYLQFVANEMYYLSATEGGPQESFANYYAYNFGSIVCLSFLLIEDPETEIWQVYFDGYLNSIWIYTRYHRNAWFNAIFLLICYENGITNEKMEDDFDFITTDIKDQLQRFAQNHFPVVNRLIELELPEGYEIIQPVKDFAENLGLSESQQKFLGIKAEQSFVNKPLTVDYFDVRIWYWEKNPYKWSPDTTENLLYEDTGSSFTVPYWMMRYMELISEGGN